MVWYINYICSNCTALEKSRDLESPAKQYHAVVQSVGLGRRGQSVGIWMWKDTENPIYVYVCCL